MKKLFLLFLICTNLLIFFNVVEVHKEKTISDAYDLYNYDNNKYSEHVSFKNELIEVNDEEFIGYLDDLTKEYNVLISAHNADYKQGYLDYYISYPHSLKETLKLETDTDLVFDASQNNYYSNQSDGIYFDTVNKDFKVHLYPLNKLLEIPNGYLTYYRIIADDEKILNLVKDDIINTYPEYISEFTQMENHVLNVSEALSKQLLIPITFSIVISSMIILIYMEKSSKKISIMKLEGYGNIQIFINLFISIILMIVLTIPISMTVYYLTFIGRINPVTIPLIKDLFKWSLIEEFLLLGLFIVYYVILICSSYSTLLKSNKYVKHLLNINFLIKLLCLVLVFPMFSNTLDYCKQITNTISVSNPLIDQTKNIEYLYSFMPGYNQDGYDLPKYYTLKFDEIYDTYQNEYKKLDELGALYFGDDILNKNNKSIPLFNINYNYLKENPLYDINGNLIEVDNSTDQVIMLIPEKYKKYHFEKDLELPLEPNNYSYIYIKNNQKYTNYAISKHGLIPEYEPCFKIYLGNAMKIDKSPFMNMYYKGDINEVLSSHFKDKVIVKNYSEDLISNNEHYIKESLNSSNLLIAVFTLLLLTTIEYTHLYFKVNNQKLAVKKLLGYSYIETYYDLYIENILIYVLMTILFGIKHIPILLVIDLIILLISSLVFEKNNIKDVLNGGEF